MPQNVLTLIYLVAGILFVLSLRGLSAQETARRGNGLGAAGMLLAVDDVQGGAQITFEATFEVEGAPKPACVAEIVFRYYV